MISTRHGVAAAMASVAALATTVVVGSTPANAHRPLTDGGADPGGQLTFVLATTHQVDVDATPANDPVGDYSAWSDDVRQNGRLVGTDAGVCTTTHQDSQGTAISALCTVIISLPDGQLDLQGLVTQLVNGPDLPGSFAVAGGTGAYRTAHGDAVATYLPNRDIKVVIHLDRGSNN